jgi:hypothetical protein
MMNTYVSLLIAGFGGGFVRGLIGYLKEQSKNYNNVVRYMDETRVFSEAVSETREGV